MTDVQKLLNYIAESTDLPGDTKIAADTSLFSAQLLDSLNLVALIAFLEDAFGVAVAPMDIAVDNFDTVERIVAYVERKRRGDV